MNARKAWLAALLLAPACGTPQVRELPPDPGPLAVEELLRSQFGCETRPWPRSKGEVDSACDSAGVLVLAASRPLVRCPFGDDVLQALLTRVLAGQRVLLLGAATRLAYDLGFEPKQPDRAGIYRWGMSDATALGTYVFGMRTRDVAAAPFVHGLVPQDAPQPEKSGEVFHFGGGELAAVQCCLWESGDPEHGEVLGRLVRVRDGEEAQLDAAVLTRWRPGQGLVVAIGALPEPWRADPRVGANARALLGNSVLTLLEGAPGSRVTLLADAKLHSAAGYDADVADAGRALRREIPGAPSLALWGVDVALDAGSAGRVPKSREQLLAQALLPSWRAGAGLVQVSAADRELGYPLAWTRDDRLARPGAWFGGDHWPQWGARGLLAFSADVQAHGLLADLRLDPAPARGGSRVELMTAMRFLGRELFDARRAPGSAFTGFLVRDWVTDEDGVFADLVRCFQPNAQALDARLRAVPLEGFCTAQDAALGRPAGLEAAGISALWRDAFPRDDVLAAVLDARTRKARGAHGHGGGSYPDWLATQAADFVRPRAGQGARVVWEGCDPQRDPATFEAVLGISLDPLKCAVAGRLLATGAGGWREIQKGFAERVQSGFGAESPLPHDTPFLQNGWMRLCGSGGPLHFDPTGTARVAARPGQAREVSPALLTTRVRGAKPKDEVTADGVVDFVHGSPRGPGGYGDEVIVRGEERGKSSLPAQLALDDAPRWPRRVRLLFTAIPGEWELELVLRGVEGKGVVEVARESEVVRLVRFATGEGSVRGAFSFPIARPGERTLSLEIVAGGAVALDDVRLVRKGELAAETTVVMQAGWRAELLEHTSSAFLVEKKRLATIADLEGFAVTIEYEHVDRGLQVSRTFELPAHRSLKKLSPRDKPMLLKEPFVLASSDPALPDLAVVPVELPRYHHFAVDAEGKLTLLGYPRSHERVRFGLVLLVEKRNLDVAQLPAVLAEACEPRVLELDQDGACELASDVGFRWPRVVRVHNPAQTPFLVEETGGYVLARGGQADPGGGDLVLCYQDPGQRVRIRGGAPVTRGTRPGPGAQGILALRGSADDQVEARVLAGHGLTGLPGVTMGAAFDEIRLDGKLWAFADGQTVVLPAGLGTHRIETRTTGRAGYPRLAATRAPILSCTWSDADQVLEIVVDKAGAAGCAPPSWPAVVTGPEPLSIEGAVRIAEDELGYKRPADGAQALAHGVVIRLGPGLTRLRYAPTALTKPQAQSL